MRVENSYFTGVINSSNKNGLIYAGSATVANSYWDITVSGTTTTTGGGTGLTTTQFQDYMNTKSLPGFDFDTIWQVQEGSPYPVFQVRPTSNESNSNGHITIDGAIQPLLLSITIPTADLTFTIDANQEVGHQFIAPTFDVQNDSNAPISLTLKTFEQTSAILNDVLPDTHVDWMNLGKLDALDVALALKPLAHANWSTLNEGLYYVANHTESEIGIIKPHSRVPFTFEALHGSTFAESLNPSYQLAFVFGLTY